jgi:hypothetical protein
MVIILVLYVLLVWLLFSKLKLVKWGWTSAITFVIGRSSWPFSWACSIR